MRGDLKEAWDSVIVNNSNPLIKCEIVKENPDNYNLNVSLDPAKCPGGTFNDEVYCALL